MRRHDAISVMSYESVTSGYHKCDVSIHVIVTSIYRKCTSVYGNHNDDDNVNNNDNGIY